ncbi:MAG: cytidine deaminase [Sphaerochaetaceae bacterium]|nr:cytidine deaminase [Spirochaetales bacterium]MDY5498795.1 cytidine deaminase [Sphaerochaetaceae bacterium]
MVRWVVCSYDEALKAEGGPFLVHELRQAGVAVGGYSGQREAERGDFSLLVRRGEGPLAQVEEGLFSCGGTMNLPLTLSAMGGEASEALAIAFTSQEVSEAKSIGMKVLAVTSQTDAVTLADSGADIIVDSLLALGRFHDAGSFEAQLCKLEDTEGESGKVRYGRNLIRPVSSSLFNLERAIAYAIEMATNVWKNAYTPYSHFNVGAAVVSAATGRVYSGCNVENGSYGATICAERNAILHAIAVEGVIGIEALVVASKGNTLAPPCAQCLQVISEFARPETQVHLVSVDGKSHEVYQFGQLLPHPFVLE